MQLQQRQLFGVIIVAILVSVSVAEKDETITKSPMSQLDVSQPKAEKLRVKKILNETKYSVQPIDAAVSLNEMQQQQQQNLKDVAEETISATAHEKIMNKQKMDDVAAHPPSHPLEAKNKTGIIKTQLVNNTDKKNLAASTTTSTSALSSTSLQHMYKGEDDISDSLKTGFYFFVALSLSAISFIVFKVYRLRLSRAERKYGVQGDRSTQELTPLPIAIEDGHSDEEDQTLFEVQRQNIRIL